MNPIAAAFIIGAFLIGSIPFAYIIVRIKTGQDIRTIGSGNPGATNVGRMLGRSWGLFVFVLDVLKGAGPAFAANAVLGGGAKAGLPLGVVLAGLAAIAGHNWSPFLGFRGGKGVATSCGVFLAIFPAGTGIALGLWIIIVALTRYISLGSMLAAVGLLACAFLLRPDPLGVDKYLTIFAGLAAVLTIFRHRTNIKRLLDGTEGKIGGEKRLQKTED